MTLKFKYPKLIHAATLILILAMYMLIGATTYLRTHFWILIFSPILISIYISRNYTLLTEKGLTISNGFIPKTYEWYEVKGFIISKTGRIKAVKNDETTKVLPCVGSQDIETMTDYINSLEQQIQ